MRGCKHVDSQYSDTAAQNITFTRHRSYLPGYARFSDAADLLTGGRHRHSRRPVHEFPDLVIAATPFTKTGQPSPHRFISPSLCHFAHGSFSPIRQFAAVQSA